MVATDSPQNVGIERPQADCRRRPPFAQVELLRRVLCWLDPIALFTVVPVCTAWRAASSSVALHLPLADLPGVSPRGRGRGRGRGRLTDAELSRRAQRTANQSRAGAEWIARLAPRFTIVTADLRLRQESKTARCPRLLARARVPVRTYLLRPLPNP